MAITTGVGALALCSSLLLVAGCYAPGLIPIYAHPPYSESLLEYLDTPGVDRTGVTRWLGDPAATRRSGALAIYVEARELGRDILGATDSVEIHYLLIEYDEAGRVARHHLLVNGGCTPWGECVSWGSSACPFDRSCESSGLGGPILPGFERGLAGWNEVGIQSVRVYATPADDAGAKAFEAEPDRCALIVYRSQEPLGVVKVRDEASGQDILLPRNGYLTWSVDSPTRELQVSWSDWRNRYSTQAVQLDCAPGTTVFQRIELSRTQFWGWRHEMEMKSVETSVGEDEVGSRWLVLR
jgi:hypothetical protein